MHDVDRYRGSCLIASKPRGGRGHPRGRAPPQDANQSQQQMSSASLDNGSTGYLLEGGSALAGMPLFSLLPQRRGSLRHPRPHIHLNHHHSHHSHHTHHNTHHQQQHQQHHQQHHQQQQQHHHHRIHRSVSHPPPLEVGVNSENGPGRGQEIIDEVERLPLARLALHTQGAPLVLATCSPQRHTPLCPTPQQGREITDGEGSLPTASDAVSVTSDEGSTGHDNCLPRIIKPRKRRKKDRKPTGGSSPTGSVEGGIRGEGDVNVDGDSGGTIVTLKPYLPMCYNYQCRGHHDLSEPRRCQISRTCGCGTCVPGHVFPTPPPSPASSSSSSSSVLCNMSSASSSCSSSEDEPTAGCCGEIEEVGVGLQCGAEDGTSSGPSVGEGRSQLVRSLSEPQPTNNNNHNNNNILHISSSITNSFAGHRDLDIRIGGSWRHELSPRTRHYSVPPPAARPTLPRGGLHYYLPVTTPQPPQRPWIHLGEPDRSKPSCIFTVMCYNVLCDKYATRQMYGYCPSWALEWDYRKKGIMDEIKQYLADIITLQEVETDQFFNFFLPELKNEGYDGIFSPKSRAKHMSENERKYVDGCAIFWRTSKFNLVKERLIEFNQLAMANHDGSEDMLNRVMTKDNIGLAALLETKEAAWENSEVAPDKSQIAQAVLVCTAHIHWDPEFCDVKLIQTIMLMSEIRQIISQIVDEAQHRTRSARKIDPSGIQLLLCGDLNSLPDSGVVEFLTKGNVSMDHEDFKGFGYKTCLQKIAMTKNNNSLVNTSANIYTHSFRLAAAYDFSIMAYTNYTYDFKGIIDYIFHSADTMSTLGVLGPIDPDWFRDNKVMGCPHPHIPSDHFSLLVQLEMRPSPSPLTHPNGLLHR